MNTLGYNHPALNKAILSQVNKLLHCSNHFYIKSQAQLAGLLVENSCGDKGLLETAVLRPMKEQLNWRKILLFKASI